MKSIISTLLLALAFSSFISGQIWNGQDTLWGNEWIPTLQPIYKIPVAETGFYRISYETLKNKGIPVESIQSDHYKMYAYGRETALYSSAKGPLASGDFLEFYAEKNKTQLDQYLYDEKAELLNKDYSLINDTSAVFLTWSSENGNGLRYTTIANNLDQAPAKDLWFWHELVVPYNETFIKNATFDGVMQSTFTKGEGYGASWRNKYTVNLQPKGLVPAEVNALLKITASSSNGFTHNLNVSLNGANIYQENFSGFQYKEIAYEKPSKDLAATEVLEWTGGAASNDRYSISRITLQYPHNFDFEGKSFFEFFLEGSNGEKYLEITNFKTGSLKPVLYDLTNHIRLEAIIDGNILKFLLPASTEKRKLVLVNQAEGFKSITELNQVTFIDFSAVAPADFVIISNNRLFDDGNGNNWVQEYADYRASQPGGGYQPIVVDVQNLYDQFAYGVNRHPLAIRHFSHYLKKTWPQVKFIFIIGKGREFHAIRTHGSLSNETNRSFYVPTFGMPGGDNLLVASRNNLTPVIPFGRIPAEDANEVRLYLEKVKIFEENSNSTDEEEREWKKYILHLGGGGSPGEQEVIQFALKQMETAISNNFFGGTVTSFRKTNSDPIQPADAEPIVRRINDGSSILTFFGHSSPIGFDFSLDNPVNYKNNPRYPLIFSLGCYTGQIHDGIKSIGESFVFQDKRGAIAFLSSSGLGYISTLQSLGYRYYSKLGGDYFGKSIGEVLQSSIADFSNNNNIGFRALMQQFTLNGDPAIKIMEVQHPDYLVEPSGIALNPGSINANLDSFELSFTLRNIGKNIPDSLMVRIERTHETTNTLLVQELKVEAPGFEKKYTLKMPTFGKSWVGFNNLEIIVNPKETIQEGPAPSSSQNNRLSTKLGGQAYRFFVYANGITPSSPSAFAIEGQSPLTLKAYTADLFSPEQNYYFQIDTTGLFNSPIMKQTSLSSKGGVLSWTPDIPWVDHTVYYWRVSADTLNGSGFSWSESSFLLELGASPGWNQSHYFQFQKNELKNLEIPQETRKLKFVDNTHTLRIQNEVIRNNVPIVTLSIDNIPFEFIFPAGYTVDRGLYVAVFNPFNGEYWKNNYPGDFGSRWPVTWARDWAFYPYWTNSQEWRAKAMQFLQDTIPSGYYVLVVSAQSFNGDYAPQEWAQDSLTLGTNLFQLFEKQGAKLIRSTEQGGGRPYVLYYKKDDPSFPVVEQLAEPGGFLTERITLVAPWDNGSMKTEPIGPASSWDKLEWLVRGDEQDSYTLSVHGISKDSTTSVLFSGFNAPDTTLQWVDPEQFPYLQLEFRASDAEMRTAPDLQHWRVWHKGLPDAVLSPNLFFTQAIDTLQQGQPGKLEFAVTNVTSIDMDSLLVSYTLVDELNRSQHFQERYRPLAANDTLHLLWTFDTKTLSGVQKIVIEVNPKDDQPEFTHANNLGIIQFTVQKDLRNPLIDVTFDGVRIINGDLVSASPHVVIQLEDENPFFPLLDSSHLRAMVKFPNSNEWKALRLGEDNLQFIPASEGKKNKATLEWRPSFAASGTYNLAVQGEDHAGNKSGTFDYTVEFEIITESRISNVFNYPNPFSTSTQFVYTLTGDTPPSQFVIQIMTINGQVVRELKESDLGPLKIGTHRTEVTWDGTDAYGDKLANGVYLYRVIAKDAEGKDFIHHDNGTDAFFQNGMGKLVILR